MAEGWTRHLKPGVLQAYSAGIEKHGLNRIAERVMLEEGVDISTHQSKTLKELAHVDFDYVITVCGHADENCPTFPGDTQVIHAPFDDPPKLAQSATTDEDALDIYRRVRDEIREYVEGLPESLSE